METNNYIARAKSFLSGRGASLAVRISPLALMAAGVAHAGTITFTAVTGDVVVSCSGEEEECGPGLTGGGTANSALTADGISFYGSASLEPGYNGGSQVIEFEYYGLGAAASGTGPGTLNISWDFTGNLGYGATGDFSGETYGYLLELHLVGASPGLWSYGGTATNGTAVTGSSTFDVGPGDITRYDADFTFTSDYGFQDFSVTIPADSSIDATNVTTTGVPEPGTLLLLTPGLALCGIRALRRSSPAVVRKHYGNWSPARQARIDSLMGSKQAQTEKAPMIH